MGVFLNGDAITEPDPRGQPVRDDSFLLLFSADSQPARFTLPGPAYGPGWEVLIDTASDSAPGQPLPGGGPAQQHSAGAVVLVAPRSMVVLRRTGTPAQPR
jgi:glycogen operon protein